MSDLEEILNFDMKSEGEEEACGGGHGAEIENNGKAISDSEEKKNISESYIIENVGSEEVTNENGELQQTKEFYPVESYSQDDLKLYNDYTKNFERNTYEYNYFHMYRDHNEFVCIHEEIKALFNECLDNMRINPENYNRYVERLRNLVRIRKQFMEDDIDNELEHMEIHGMTETDLAVKFDRYVYEGNFDD